MSTRLTTTEQPAPGIQQVWSMTAEAAHEVIEGLAEGGVNFVGVLPESEFLTAQTALMNDDRFITVPVCNESSGVSICSGAWAGGKKPAMLLGVAGFTVASYALAGVCIRHSMPTVVIVTSRELGDQNWIFGVWNAHTLDPFLKALNFPYARADRVADVRKVVRDACKTTFGWLKPYVVILTGEVVM